MNLYQANDALLRLTMKINAVFFMLFGISFVFFSNSIARLMMSQEISFFGVTAEELFFEMGLILVVFGGLVYLSARRPILNSTQVKLIISADVFWVIGCAIILADFSSIFSELGRDLVAFIIVDVALLAVAGLLGLVCLYQGDSKIKIHRNHSEMQVYASRESKVPLGCAWGVISDLESYSEVADNLSKVEVIHGQGIGMVRRCTDTKGNDWQETCTAWIEGESYSFRVHTEAEDYPYPIAGLSGTWSVESSEFGSVVKMHFIVSSKPGFLNLLVFKMMAMPFVKICHRLLVKWTAKMEQHPQIRSDFHDDGSEQKVT